MTEARPSILCAMPESTYRMFFDAEMEAELRALGTVVRCLDAGALSDDAYAALWVDADAAVTGWGTRFPSAELLGRCPRLKAVCHTAGTVRGVPREAIERGLTVTSARSAIARTVAEFCLMNAMLLLRRMPAYIDRDPERWAALAGGKGRPEGRTLFGKTIGLVGLGCVGRTFRAMLASFGCRVLVFDPFVSAEVASAEGVEPVALDDLLRRCDVVSLHAPDIPETRGMIGARELATMRDGAVLLNSARGRLIDTDALTAEMQRGRLLAAIDVTEPEPLPEDHPLRHLPNVVWTPHVAGPTPDDYPHLTRTALDDLRRCLAGEPPRYAISLPAYDIMSF